MVSSTPDPYSFVSFSPRLWTRGPRPSPESGPASDKTSVRSGWSEASPRGSVVSPPLAKDHTSSRTSEHYLVSCIHLSVRRSSLIVQVKFHLCILALYKTACYIHAICTSTQIKFFAFFLQKNETS
jgi:hypothetical protein